MINWNEHHQVGVTLCPEFTESEDHIVPHPMETKEDALSPVEDNGKDKKVEIVNADLRSIEQHSQAKNNNTTSESESTSSFQINEEFSSSRMEIDPWIDLPNYCINLGDARTEGNDHNSAATEMINDLSATNMNSMGGDALQLESSMFGFEDKGNCDFLDCDWENFGNFDDIEMLFRNNDSIFGHNIGDAEGFLSPSKDVIDSTAQSIPLPDLPLCKDQASDEGSTSFQLAYHSDKQSSPLHRDQVDRQKTTSTSENTHGKIENRLSKTLKNALAHNYRPSQHNLGTGFQSLVDTARQTSQSKATSQQVQFSDAKPTEHCCASNQVIITGNGYHTYSVPSIPLSQNVQVDMNQKRPVCASYEVGSTNKKRPKASTRPDAKPLTMTPQEKMEKLRRLQKIQAQLAIEQQHQQYSNQITCPSVAVSQSCSLSDQTIDAKTSNIQNDDTAYKLPSSLLDMLSAEQDESKKTSDLSYDPSVQETIYNQLQDAVEKLDMRVRFCIRDSLLRLARSAMERQSARDRSSTNISNKDEDEASADELSKNQNRSMWLADPETDTNCIDRIVASLLFQLPTDSGLRIGKYEHIGST